MTVQPAPARSDGSRPFDIIGFDLDGTLLDSSGDIAAALNHALVSVGRDPLPVEQVQTMVGRGLRNLITRALAATGGGGSPELVEQLFATSLDYYADHPAVLSKPYPGVVDALAALSSRGYRLAVCTNKVEHLARLVLEQLGMSHFFAAIVGGDTTPTLKPDPAPLHAMIAAAGGGRTLFVGDSDNDILAAKAAGVANVAVSFGYIMGEPEDLDADALIAGFDELVPLIEGW